jgi:hypothetical protein
MGRHQNVERLVTADPLLMAKQRISYACNCQAQKADHHRRWKPDASPQARSAASQRGDTHRIRKRLTHRKVSH